MKKILFLLLFLLLNGCADSEKKDAVASTDNKKTESNSNDHQEGNTYLPKFIKAAELHNLMKNNQKVYVFDVRDKLSYDQAHIKGAVSTPIPITITSAALKSVPLNAQLVTYCGCPHHLSSIGAEQLEKIGYKNVKVLDEGFWYWKDNKLPIVEAKNNNNKISKLVVEGILKKESRPVKNTDIYLRHIKTGQMEATRTDDKGYYKMSFHLYNYQKKDEFKFYFKSLENPLNKFSTEKDHEKNVVVNIL